MEKYLESVLKNDDLVKLNGYLDCYFWDLLFVDKEKFIKTIEFFHIPNKELGDIKINFLEKFIEQKKVFFKNRHKKPKTKLDLLDCLNFDLNFVQSLIDDTIEKRDYKYYIFSSNREIIDVTNLKNYLRKLDNQNQYVLTTLKEILFKADKIIEYDNTVLSEIEKETDSKGIHNHINFGGFGFSNLNGNYECKKIIDFKIYGVNLSSEKARDNFAENNKRETFQINDFSRKCSSVINILTSFLCINDRDEFNLFIGNKISIITKEKQLLLNPILETKSINLDNIGFNIYTEILSIINNPIRELIKENLYFKSIDENGKVIYLENNDPEILNVDIDITEPFSKLESMTSKLMETTTHSIVLDGYLKKIFKEFIEIFKILIDIYDNDILIESEDKYPKNFTFYCYMSKYYLSKYYDFIIEFLDDKFLEIENKVFVNDFNYLIKENKSETETIEKTKEAKSKNLNNHLKSTIEDYLEEFKDEINSNGYELLINALFDYFSNGTFPILTSKINFKRINKKKVGWALKELHKSEKTDSISFDYISFAKDNINLFADEILEEHNFRKSNLYKAFTTNPAK